MFIIWRIVGPARKVTLPLKGHPSSQANFFFLMLTARQVLKGHVVCFFFLCKIKLLCCLQSNKERLNLNY